MKTYGRMDVQIHVFLTSALVGGEQSDSRPGHFTPAEEPAIPIGWVGPRAGLDHELYMHIASTRNLDN
jgi:hypothetical protein